MSATRDEVLRASASISETVAEMCDALRIMEIKHPDSIPLDRMEAILSAARAKGWQLVPVEPTEEMIEDMAIKLYEERARNLGLPMAKWENAPEMVRSLERRDAAAAYRLVLAAAPRPLACWGGAGGRIWGGE